MRLLRSIGKDIRLQFRHGFYLVYLILSAVYIVALFLSGPELREILHSLFIFADPSTMGYVFVGGIVLLERQEHSLLTVFVTPLTIQEYLWSKVLSINLLSLTASVLITLFVKGFNFNPFLFVWSVTITSPIFTLLGLAITTRFKSLNALLIVTGLVAAFINAPLIGYFQFYYSSVFEFFPPLASLHLIDMALEHTEWNTLLFLQSSGILALWSSVMYLWAHRWFQKYLVSQSGVKI